MQAAKNGDLHIEERTPENAMSLAEEIRQLRSEVKRLNKENNRLQEERDFLNEAAKMMEIVHEDECNDTYGRERMHKALLLKYPDSGIPSETTVYRVMTAIGITHRPNRKPNGITKADREARKSDDLTTVGLSMDDNMRAELCAATVENTAAAYPEFSGAVLNSDRGSQYTSDSYRAMLSEYEVKQSMNSAGGRCHDNARCESKWARMKNELFYSRGRRSTDYTTEQLKTMIWRCYMSY